MSSEQSSSDIILAQYSYPLYICASSKEFFVVDKTGDVIGVHDLATLEQKRFIVPDQDKGLPVGVAAGSKDELYFLYRGSVDIFLPNGKGNYEAIPSRTIPIDMNGKDPDAIAVSKAGDLAITFYGTNNIFLLKACSPEKPTIYECPSAIRACGVAFCDDGKLVISDVRQETIHVIDTRDTSTHPTFTFNTKDVNVGTRTYPCSIAVYDEMVVVAERSMGLAVFSLTTGALLKRKPYPNSHPFYVAVSPKGQVFLSAMKRVFVSKTFLDDLM
jgi:DNA-binding beta-propeller fold protein YncE